MSRSARARGGPRRSARRLESGELKTLLLFGVDPLRDFPDTDAWKTALAAADHVVVFSTFENATTAMADVVFPLETHAEKDGTVTHPDGRLQRVRPSACAPRRHPPQLGRPGRAIAGARPRHRHHLPALSFRRLGRGGPLLRGHRPTPRSAAEESAGRTVRSAASAPQPGTARVGGVAGARAELRARAPPATAESRPAEAAPDGALTLGTYRDLWAGPITELNPPLKFLQPQQRVELSLADAERLGSSTATRSRSPRTAPASRPGRDQGAGRGGRLLPDRGHRRGQRQRPAQRRPGQRRDREGQAE